MTKDFNFGMTPAPFLSDSMIAAFSQLFSSSDLPKNKLFKAACIGDNKRIIKLSKDGYNINSQDKDGNTALHYAVKHGQIQTCKLLVSLGTDITIKNNSGSTAMDLLSSQHGKNYFEFLEFLTAIEKIKDHGEYSKPPYSRSERDDKPWEDADLSSPLIEVGTCGADDS